MSRNTSQRDRTSMPNARTLSATILAAAIGLTGCAGSGTNKTQDPPDNRARAARADAAAKKGKDPKPPVMRRIPAPVPAYAVPVTKPMRPKPMRDPGPVAEYAAPALDR